MSTIDRILELVKDSGLTAKDFADKAGIAGGSITDWKTGRSKPSIPSLEKIADYTGVQLEWLTCGSEFKTKEDEIKSFLIDKIGIEQSDYDTAFFIKAKERLSKSEYDALRQLDDLWEFHNDTEKYENECKRILTSLNEQSVKKVKREYEKIKHSIIVLLTKVINSSELIQELDNSDNLLDKYTAINKYYKKEQSNTFPTPTNKLHMCPVYGRIAAGIPNWAEQCMEGTLPLDPDMMHINNPEECFFLRVSGESMNKVIKNGGYALIRKQEDVENGEIAVVLVNGYDATLKKFTKKDNMVILEPMSDDPTFQIQLYGPETPIQILGKYIGKFEMN